MRDDKKPKIESNDEYQYPSEEYVHETTSALEETEKPSKRNPLDIDRFAPVLQFLQNNKKIVIIVLVIIVVMIAFKIMNSHKGHQMKPVMRTPAAQPLLPKTPIVMHQASPQVEQQLGVLKQNQQSSSETLSELNAQVQSLRNQINQSNTQQATLNDSIITMARAIKALQSQVKTLHQVKSATSHIKVITSKPTVYYLKAVVPGRAWIISNNGLTMSVAVGDMIPHYGRVDAVEANRGMILTSSGKIIQYGTNDH